MATAALFAACSENDLIVDNFMSGEAASQESAIGFGSGMNNMVGTRAENSNAEEKNDLENFWYTMRIWGYKNIKNTDGTFTSTAVFNADTDNPLYEKSIATWTASGLAAPFDAKDWYYSPVRYWDKTATSYDFHAAAPDTLPGNEALNWEWHQVMADGTVWNAAQADGEGAGYFTLADFQLNGESLPLSTAVSNGDTAVFGGKTPKKQEWTTKDIDLMIATDVTGVDPKSHTSVENGNARVTFDFNHILSRLNIGIKIGNGVAVKYDKNAEEKDILEKPVEGVVMLGRVEIVGLNTKGSFDEGVLQIPDNKEQAMNGENVVVTTGTLAMGTTKRWSSLSSATTAAVDNNYSTYGFPNEKVNGKKYQERTKDDSLNLTKLFTDKYNTGIKYKKDDFKMIFQGLVIPQTVEYDEIPLDGSKLGDKPYLKISYSLDGEVFTNYYNLAAIFSKYNDEYKATINNTEYHAYKTDNGNEYAYSLDESLDESSLFVDKDGQPLAIVGYQDAVTKKYYVTDKSSGYQLTDDEGTKEPEGDGIILMCNATENSGVTISLIKPTRGEADKAEIAADECTVSFNEGWQNNLWITINPTAILFDADVYKWADYETEIKELTVE